MLRDHNSTHLRGGQPSPGFVLTEGKAWSVTVAVDGKLSESLILSPGLGYRSLVSDCRPHPHSHTHQPPEQPLELRRVLPESPGHAAAGPRRAAAQAPAEQGPHVLH